jgi:hypothetical protein
LWLREFLPLSHAGHRIPAIFLRCPLFSIGSQRSFSALLAGMMRRNAPAGFPQTQSLALNSKLRRPANDPSLPRLVVMGCIVNREFSK